MAQRGAIVLAIMPAPLLGPAILTRMGGRMDLAGALVLGTLLLSLLVMASREAIGSTALSTALATFAVAAMVANGVPTLRDRLLAPLSVAGVASAATIAALAVVMAPIVDLNVMIAAAALFVAGVSTSAVVAVLTRRDVVAAIAGAGLRDPLLAVAFEVAVSGNASSSGVALVYAAFCLGLAALGLARR